MKGGNAGLATMLGDGSGGFGAVGALGGKVGGGSADGVEAFGGLGCAVGAGVESGGADVG